MKKNLFKRTGLLNAGDNLQNELKKLKFVLLVVFNCLSLSLFAQQRITGTISSRDSLLEGVTIQVKGGTAATQTDAKGNFTITAPSNATLVITIVGYVDQEVKVGNRSTINVQLQPSTSQLTDVVVVGYGTQRKATVTGAVTAVRGTELDKSPGLNLSNSLAGRLPGVTAMQRSGEPGFDASTIRIRGTNTLGNSGPLIVIDGVPDRAGGLDRLNPADVENVSVLKDASAAIYGARAANGVILITTKQGKAGKPLVSYDFSNGWQQPTIVPKMGNAAQYAELLNEQVMFSNIPANQWEAAWQALKTTGSYTRTDNAQKVNAFYSPEDIQKFTNGSSPLTHPNTDWYRAVFKDWSGQQQHSLQISGGSEAIKFLASAGYQNQDAYYKNSATGYKQYDMRINLEARVNKYISATLGLTAREEFRFFPTVGAGDIFRMLIRGKPTEMAVWPNGLPGPDIENGQNPVVVTTGQTGYDRDRRDYFQTNGQIEIRNPWVEGLKFTLQGAADKLVRRTKRFQTPWALYFWDKVSYEDANKTIPKLTRTVRSTFSDPMLRLADEEELRINLTGMVNYDRVIGEGHTISFLAGVQKETRRGDNFFAYRRNFISPAVDQLNVGGTAQQDVGGTGFEQARLSYFGRAAYNYREKYLAEFVWRYDGSYIFPEVGRFGFFPGVLVGWNISKESFFQNVKAVNNLKLRGSYGQLGNDRVEFNGVLQEYAYLSTYSLSGVQVINGQQQRSLTEVRVPNTNFTWEVANNANIGLEGALFNNKITFELDVFRNLRKQILIARAGSTPQSTGITSLLPPVNEGKVENKGWEFRVGYNGRAGKDLTFNVSVNGGYAKNKVLFWDENPGVPKWQQATGHPFGTNGYAFLAYQYDGAFRDAKEIADNKIDYSAATNNLRPGDMKFIDYNGDGKINNLDQVRIDRTRDPRFTGGVNINVAYKNFDLSVLFQAATGGLQLLNFNETGEFGNWLQYSYNNRWSVDNPSSVDPRLVSRQNTYYTSGFRNNTYWLRSNDYLRFKNFEFGYTLGGRVGERVGISRLRLYVSGLNLVTWQKLAIWDPEETAENGYVYPQARIINAGVRVTF
jgi:TonB-linked SusC/RagA family outer membrane protein